MVLAESHELSDATTIRGAIQFCRDMAAQAATLAANPPPNISAAEYQRLAGMLSETVAGLDHLAAPERHADFIMEALRRDGRAAFPAFLPTRVAYIELVQRPGSMDEAQLRIHNSGGSSLQRFHDNDGMNLYKTCYPMEGIRLNFDKRADSSEELNLSSLSAILSLGLTADLTEDVLYGFGWLLHGRCASAEAFPWMRQERGNDSVFMSILALSKNNLSTSAGHHLESSMLATYLDALPDEVEQVPFYGQQVQARMARAAELARNAAQD